METQDTIKCHFKRAQELASTEVERLARKIMREHSEAAEFVMGMGVYGFWDRADNEIHDKPYTTPLDDFIGEWDDTLHITGEPMRFTAAGPIVRDW